MFFHNPLIGIGPNNFRQLCAEKDYGIYEERGCSTHLIIYYSSITS